MVVDSIHAGLGILAPAATDILDLLLPDALVGFGSTVEAGPIAIHQSGSSPTLDALRGGQSAGLGMWAGLDLDAGVMRPDLTLTALATAGIPGPIALVSPDHAGAGGSFVLALQSGERNGLELAPSNRRPVPIT
jgi:hypothetical protein